MSNNKIDPNRKRFEAVIFDMDGVLVDSEPIHLQSTIRTMNDSFGIHFTVEDDREFLGTTDHHMFSILKKRYNLEPPIEDLIALRKQVYRDLLESGGIPWRDGMQELVADLSRAGVRIALASSGLRYIIEMILEQGRLTKFFEAIVTGNDVEASKPAPDIYAEAMRQLGMPPDVCVAIEDTDVGVRSAKDAGACVIAFPAESTAFMDFSLADTVVSSSTEIRAILLPE